MEFWGKLGIFICKCLKMVYFLSIDEASIQKVFFFKDLIGFIEWFMNRAAPHLINRKVLLKSFCFLIQWPLSYLCFPLMAFYSLIIKHLRIYIVSNFPFICFWAKLACGLVKVMEIWLLGWNITVRTFSAFYIFLHLR